jgi:hypothetical protein
MNVKFKIFLTNWINMVGIFIAVYLSTVISELLKIQSANDISSALGVGFLGGLFAIVFYGSIFWAGFAIAMFVMDFILMNKNKEQLRLKLLIEWILISSPFIYWFIQYTEWIFLVAVISFFITQAFRVKRILKVI